MNAAHFVITSRDPQSTRDAIHGLPSVYCEVVPDSFDGERAVFLIEGDLGFARYSITQQGYGEILEERPVP